MFAKMISMARSKEQAKEEIEKNSAPLPSAEPSVPTYPWGLCISLEDETLEKLGIDGDLPQVGEVIQFTAMAKVTSASSSEREGPDGAKKESRRIELQITDMGVPQPDPAAQAIEASAARRKRFYPAMEAGDDD